MKSGHYILPFCLSVAIHVGVLLAGGPGHTAEAPFEPGLAAVRVRLAPSPRIQAAAPPVVVEPAPPAPTTPRPPEPARPVEPPRPEPLAAVAPPMPAMPDQPVVEAPPVEPVEVVEPTEPVESAAPPTVAQAEPTPPEPVKAPVTPTPAATSVARNGSLRKAGVTPAKAIGLNRLAYPRVSRRLGHQGTVTVEVEVLPTGRAGDVRLVKSSGHKRLDQAVVKHMKKCKFRPAHNGRRAIRSTPRISYKFRLTKANR